MAAFNIRKDLKAYVKYGLKNGQKIVPGSLIFRKDAPRDPGIWREVPTVKCCQGGGACGAGGFWIDVIEQESYYYPISTSVGNDCSIYYFGQSGYGALPQFLKFNSDGSLVWNSPYDTDGGSGQNLQSIKVIPDNSGAIAVFEFTITNLSSEDGSILWNKSFGSKGMGVNILGVTFNKAGEIIVFATDYDVLFIIVKMDPSTGAVLVQKQADFTDTANNPYVDSYMVPRIDSSGNIYTCGTLYSDIEGPVVVKFDKDFNLIWAVTLEMYYNSYTESESFDVDGSGNSYIVVDASRLTKLNPDGSHAWTVYLQGTETLSNIDLSCCAASPQGDVYWVYNNNNYLWDPAGDGTNEIAVLKFNTEGVLQWATAIAYAPGGNKQTLYVGGWNGTNDPIEFKNGVLVICGNMPNDQLNHLLKISPTQTIGTFGDFIYEDITSLIAAYNESTAVTPISPEMSNSIYFDDGYDAEFTPYINPVIVTTIPTIL